MDRQAYNRFYRLVPYLLVMIVWLGNFSSSFGQQTRSKSENYEKNIRKANKAMKNKDYENAIIDYSIAKLYANTDQMKVIVDSMRSAFNGYTDMIELLERRVAREKDRADRAEAEVQRLNLELETARQRIQVLEEELQATRREMELQSRYSEARRLASQARQVRERGNTKDALLLAALAKGLADGMKDPSIDRAFAQAVLSERGRRLSGQGAGFTMGEFSAGDNPYLLAVSRDYSVYVWDTTGQAVDTLKGHKDFILSAGFSLDGQHVLTASLDATARWWSLNEDQVDTLTGHRDAVSGVAFSPTDENRFLTYSRDGTVRLWHQEGESLHSSPLTGHLAHVLEASFSTDGKFVLTRGADNLVIIWAVATGEKIHELKHDGYVYSAAFSPDDASRVLTTCSCADQKVRLWTDGEEQPMDGHTELVTDGAFHPDGLRFATASTDRNAILWKQSSSGAGKLLEGHNHWISTLVFSPDGTHFLTLSKDLTVRIWDEDGNPGAVLQGHQKKIRTAVFSPDGTAVLTASNDGTAKLWDLQGNVILNIPFEKEVTDALFSPDGKYLLATSLGGTAVLCPLPETVYRGMKPSLAGFSEEERTAYGLNEWPSFLCEWLHEKTGGCPVP